MKPFVSSQIYSRAHDARVAIQISGYCHHRVIPRINGRRTRQQAHIAIGMWGTAGVGGVYKERIRIGQVVAQIHTATGHPYSTGVTTLHKRRTNNGYGKARPIMNSGRC